MGLFKKMFISSNTYILDESNFLQRRKRRWWRNAGDHKWVYPPSKKYKKIKKIQVKEREKEQKKRKIYNNAIPSVQKKRLLCIYLKWNIFFHFSCLTHLLFSSYSYFVNLFFFVHTTRSFNSMLDVVCKRRRERKKEKKSIKLYVCITTIIRNIYMPRNGISWARRRQKNFHWINNSLCHH